MTNLPIPKGKNKGLEKNWTKERLIPSRQNTKSSYSSIFNTRPHCGQMWVVGRLGSPITINLLVTAHITSLQDSLYSCLQLPLADNPHSWISESAGSPLHFRLHSHSFKLCTLRGPLSDPPLPGLPLKSEWKPLWLKLLYLHVSKTTLDNTKVWCQQKQEPGPMDLATAASEGLNGWT